VIRPGNPLAQVGLKYHCGTKSVWFVLPGGKKKNIAKSQPMARGLETISGLIETNQGSNGRWHREDQLEKLWVQNLWDLTTDGK
jgi:hypothetical protein